MAERATVFQTPQLGVEVTPGTAVPAVKRPVAISIEPKAMVPTVQQRNNGSKFVNSSYGKKEYTMADVKGEACFRTLAYLFCSILENVSPTTPGGATNARLWTFTPNTYGPDSVKTFTIESGSDEGAVRFSHAVLDSLAIRSTKDEVGISGSMFGKQLDEEITLTDGIDAVYTVTLGGPSAGDFTLTYSAQTTAAIAYDDTGADVQAALEALNNIAPGDVAVTGGAGGPFVITFGGDLGNMPITLTANFAGLTGGTPTIVATTTGVTTADITPVPLDPTQCDVYLGTSVGGLTQLTRAFEVEFAINNRFGMVFTLDTSEESYSAVVEKAPELSAQIVIEHDAASAALMTQFRGNDLHFARFKWTGEDIESGQPYLLQITFPFFFKDNSRGDKDDVWSSTWQMVPAHDATFGGALEVQLKNDLTSL